MYYHNLTFVLTRVFIRQLAVATLFMLALTGQSRTWDQTDRAVFPVKIQTSNDSVTLIPSNPEKAAELQVNFTPGGGGYPGISMQPLEEKTWDFSNYTGLELTLTSTSQKAIYVTMRVDNPGDWQKKPWNSGSARLDPGAKKTIRVYFGFGSKGPAYPLDSSKVSNILIFTGNASEGQAFTIDSLVAIKRPVPFRPDAIPENGVIFAMTAESPKIQVIPKAGAKVSESKLGPLSVSFTAGTQAVHILPEGNALWNFNQGYLITATIRNSGSTPVSPGLQVTSKNGDTGVATLPEPLSPGQTAEIKLSFIADESSVIEYGTKNKFFDSNDAVAVAFLANGMEAPQNFEVTSIRLDAPPITLPNWSGKRPPVEGDWTLTFDENFDGDAIDLTTWNVHAPNWYDKISRYSQDNVEVQDGKAVMTFEKKAGQHNDDPNSKRKNNYTTGYIDTYGKWVQRYGYFEARMKLPRANGLWPAFWLMPDRGLDEGEQWRRQNIALGGMEFDIMEFLSGWGPHRFTTAFHWDGYTKNHKAAGAGVYTAHDAEGFITTGLLWLPGLAVIYNNGKEVARWEADRISTIESNIIFTFVAGGWDNTALQDSELPETFELDYVRVWQRADLASDVDGVQSRQSTTAAPTQPDK